MNTYIPIGQENFPDIDTERLRLRNFEAADAPALLRLRSDARFLEHIGIEPMTEPAQAEARIRQNIEANAVGACLNWALGLKPDDEFIGYCGFWNHQPGHFRAEIGYGLLPDFWGRGLASEAVRAALAYGFGQIGLHSVVAMVNAPHAASRRVLERCGFREEGLLRESFCLRGVFVDTVVYGLLKPEFERNLRAHP